MQFTKDEQIYIFKQLNNISEEYPPLKNKIEMLVWIMLERLDNINKRQERYGDI